MANLQELDRAELIRKLNNVTGQDSALCAQAAALLEADAKGGEAVRYEYRWLNPANNPGDQTEAMEWKLVELRNPYTDTMQSRVRELESYRYNGKPVYEVRALYTRPQQAAQVPLTDEEIREACKDIWGSDYGGVLTLSLEQAIARAIEAAHGIGKAERTCGACGKAGCVAGECGDTPVGIGKDQG